MQPIQVLLQHKKFTNDSQKRFTEAYVFLLYWQPKNRFTDQSKMLLQNVFRWNTYIQPNFVHHEYSTVHRLRCRWLHLYQSVRWFSGQISFEIRFIGRRYFHELELWEGIVLFQVFLYISALSNNFGRVHIFFIAEFIRLNIQMKEENNFAVPKLNSTLLNIQNQYAQPIN